MFVRCKLPLNVNETLLAVFVTHALLHYVFREQMWLRLMLFGAVLAFLLTLAVASTVTVGFSRWCSSFPPADDITYVFFESQTHQCFHTFHYVFLSKSEVTTCVNNIMLSLLN